MSELTLDRKSSLTKKKQIIKSIEQAIITKKIKKGDKLPSINSLKIRLSISRDTVLDAYGDLKRRGIIISVAGKGYYLKNEKITVQKRIFLLFDEINPFKENLYNSFINNLKHEFEVDTYFHHFNFDFFRNMILNNVGNYSHYVIMPANFNETKDILAHIDPDRVFLLDQLPNGMKKFAAVYQNFEMGVNNNLVLLNDKILNYKKIILIYDFKKQPEGILRGFTRYCKKYEKPFKILHSKDDINIRKNYVYMTLDDSSLISIIKQVKEKKFIIKREIGLISFNESPLKEIIEGGITTISTDFSMMGKKLAVMIESNNRTLIENEIKLISRNSI
jgi:DNA-binding transcriptional regulator YhcF (GntR family)